MNDGGAGYLHEFSNDFILRAISTDCEDGRATADLENRVDQSHSQGVVPPVVAERHAHSQCGLSGCMTEDP